MEGLSAAASAFAVVGLAGQILSGIQTLTDFWVSIEDAPSDIRDILYELQLLAAILRRIQTNDANGCDDNQLLIDALQSCKAKVDSFLAFMEQLRPAYDSSSVRVRTWKTFKAAFHGNTINKFRVSLGETKLTLLLIRQDLSEHLQYTFRDQVMTSIVTGASNIKVNHETSTTVTTVESSVANPVKELHCEIRRMSRTMSNPVFRAGYEAGMNSALNDLNDFIKSKKRKSSISRSSTTRSLTRSNTTSTSSSDLEKNIGFDKDDRVKTVEDAYTSLTETLVGNFYVQSKRLRVHNRGENPKVNKEQASKDEKNDDYEYQTAITYHPPQWLLRWNLLASGVDIMLLRSTQGWKNTLRTFHAIADDAPIFSFCKSGNIDGVKTLLAYGQASPLDTDTKGWTPLHYAAQECNLRLCQLLIDAGADQNALSYDYPGGDYEICSPLIMASTIRREKSIPWKQRLKVLRILMKATELDFSRSDSQGWKLVQVLLERSRPSSRFTTDRTGAKWVLDIFRDEIRAYCPPKILYWLILFCIEDEYLCRKLLEIHPEAMNATLRPGGFSIILTKTADGLPDIVVPSFKVLAEHGVDLHYVGKTMGPPGRDRRGQRRNSKLDTNGPSGERRCMGGPPSLETATSLALKHSASFYRWRTLLMDLNIDLSEFVRREIQAGPVAVAGWTYTTLLKAFEVDFEPQEKPRPCCTSCGREVHRILRGNQWKETWWEDFTYNIRHSQEDADSDGERFWSLESGGELENFPSACSSLERDKRTLCWKCRRPKGRGMRPGGPRRRGSRCGGGPCLPC